MSSGGNWNNLDAATSFDDCLGHLKGGQPRNFAVRFNAEDASCALDISQADVESLLKTRNHTTVALERETLWLNFWAGHTDAAAISSIVKRYGLSPRLASLLYQKDTSKTLPQREQPEPAASGARHNLVDVEKASSLAEAAVNPVQMTRPPGFGDVVDNLWHFCSVDRGPEYLYVGFNALFTVPGVSIKHDVDPGKPTGLRIWTSLLLCQDGTVVSIFEGPPPGTPREYIQAMRFNVLNNLRHLSKLRPKASLNSLMHVNVRPDPSSEHFSIQDSDAAPLLFYYLFDDWMTTYALITQRHNPYRDHLESIRRVMFDAADMDLVKSLDLVGRQLTALKLVYQSYELTIRRILKHSNTEARGSWDSDAFDRTYNMSAEQAGFNLPMAAIDRFERLLDRIRLYALTEIEECLRQKESLVFMNFNLVALKESHAVEKLTRTTILLAKVTILFLPVSLMTGYFSIQLSEIGQLYNLKTYWVCFAVVVVASTLVLVCFGAMSFKAGGKTTYKSLTRTFWDKVWRTKPKRH